MSESIVKGPFAESGKNRGWRVVMAALGINLALGILYTWSVISKGIPPEWNWTEAHKALPYAFACLTFSIIMVPAGIMQDKIGPRLVATIGGVLVGAGMILASRTTDPTMFVLAFGVLTGAGLGFGYASATPPSVKWFPSAKTGLIAGIVVSGFGLASVYAAPLTNYLIGSGGVSHAMLVLGIAFLVVVVALAQFLKAPPKGYVPAGQPTAKAGGADKPDFTTMQMLKTPQFYMIWFMYACAAGAGLMIIGSLAGIGKMVMSNPELAYVLLIFMAIGNGGGRVLAGVLSDRLGRTLTMFGCFVVQAGAILLLSLAASGNVLASVPMMVALSMLIGANYGANLTLFPSITKDYYGLKNFGSNYGLVFTAWGVGGFMLALLAGKLYVAHQTFVIAYYGACGLLVLASVMSFAVKAPRHPSAAAAVRRDAA